MAQKNFDEYFAKLILEQCFPEKFPLLEVKDKPDLRCGAGIGIEVTNCTPEKVNEAFYLAGNIINRKGNIERNREHLDKLGVVEEINRYGVLWRQEPYTDDTDTSPIKNFLDAVEKKVERLNSDTANYAEMERYELFVNSDIYILDRAMMCKTYKRLSEINIREKKYSTIYLLTNEERLLVFDMIEQKLWRMNLVDKLGHLAQEARKLAGGKN